MQKLDSTHIFRSIKVYELFTQFCYPKFLLLLLITFIQLFQSRKECFTKRFQWDLFLEPIFVYYFIFLLHQFPVYLFCYFVVLFLYRLVQQRQPFGSVLRSLPYQIGYILLIAFTFEFFERIRQLFFDLFRRLFYR